jgi:aminoglycoside phosphotransferase family enzyme/predicted kinase
MSTTATSRSLREDLLRPEAYGRKPPFQVELIETHISLVFLAEGVVYKVKKPLDLGFVDFRELEARKLACEAEVTLNRRLAPHVYFGTVPVRRTAEGAGLIGDGPIIDWAVHMMRLPEARRADVMLSRGALQIGHIERIASSLARFHREARSDEETARFGSPEAVGVNVRENFEQTRASIGKYLRPEEAAEIERYQLAFLRDNAALFHERMAAGRVRDGHGDLRLEHVYFEDEKRVTVLDCIEFADRFRFADTGADIAFMSMDLAYHGRVDLAEHLLAAYAREAGDFDLYPLIDFYESYRAFVKGKVAMILAADPEAQAAARAHAEEEARRYLLLSLATERAPMMPRAVVAVGGVIGSGKSTLATALAGEMGAAVVEADRTRKQLFGVEPTVKLYEESFKGAYDPSFTEKVYEEVLRRASKVLVSGRPVILDASFRSAAMRRSARELADRFKVPFRFVECRADAEVCKSRLKARRVKVEVSDGRLEIFDEFCKSFEAVTELPQDEHIRVDTGQPLAASLEALRAAVSTWPKGLVT